MRSIKFVRNTYTYAVSGTLKYAERMASDTGQRTAFKLLLDWHSQQTGQEQRSPLSL